MGRLTPSWSAMSAAPIGFCDGAYGVEHLLHGGLQPRRRGGRRLEPAAAAQVVEAVNGGLVGAR